CTLTVELAVAAAPVPLIRSLTISFLGGGPDGMATLGLVFSAAGSGVLLVVVLVALAALLVVAELLAEAVLVAEVRPAEGASCTPAAVDPLLLPHPATAAASASAVQVMVVVFLMRGPRVARAVKKRRRTALRPNGGPYEAIRSRTSASTSKLACTAPTSSDSSSMSMSFISREASDSCSGTRDLGRWV